MYPDLFDKAMYDRFQAKDSDVSCMLLSMIGGWNSEEDLHLYSNLDVWEYDVGEDLDAITSEYLDAVPDELMGEVRTWTPEEMFKKIYGLNFDMGARRTWIEMNKRFPGHKVS
jgi:hypothetical protein